MPSKFWKSRLVFVKKLHRQNRVPKNTHIIAAAVASVFSNEKSFMRS